MFHYNNGSVSNYQIEGMVVCAVDLSSSF